MRAELESRLRKQFAQDVQCGLTRGMQCYVSRGGRVLADLAVGRLGQDDRPLTPTTRMHLYSSSKPFTATAVHVLVGRGQVAYDDLVTRYLPGYGRHGKGSTTIEHLLTHCAGIPAWQAKIPLDVYADLPAAVARLGALIPESPPGTLSVYHPLTVFTLLSAVIEEVVSAPFSTYVEEEILAPLGLQRTTWGVPVGLADDVNDTYADDAVDEEVEASWRTPSVRATAIASGGLYGTARDLGRFYELWLEGLPGLLPRGLAEQATVLRRPVTSGAGWGRGFWVGRDDYADGRGTLLSRRSFGHPGLHTVQSLADPESGLVVAMIANVNPGRERNDRRFDRLCDLIVQTAVEDCPSKVGP